MSAASGGSLEGRCELWHDEARAGHRSGWKHCQPQCSAVFMSLLAIACVSNCGLHCQPSADTRLWCADHCSRRQCTCGWVSCVSPGLDLSAASQHPLTCRCADLPLYLLCADLCVLKTPFVHAAFTRAWLPELNTSALTGSRRRRACQKVRSAVRACHALHQQDIIPCLVHHF